MKVLIISSSQQTQSNSVKVAHAMSGHAKDFEKVDHIDLIDLNLPFYSPEAEPQKHCQNWDEIEQKIAQADAYVMITPEWNGTASPILKNFLYFLDSAKTSNKPVMLVSVSSGISGVYPIAELKGNAFKNNKLVPIPDHMVIRDVENFLNDEKSGQSDHSLIARMDFSLNMLYQYAQALKPVRAFSLNHEQSFAYGM